MHRAPAPTFGSVTLTADGCARRLLRCAAFAACLTASATAAADGPASPLLAPPGAPGFDAHLGALADGFQRQQDVFAARENGLSLDVIFKPEDITTVVGFFAQTATNDFQAFSGLHPFAVVDHFDEHGDEGNFAGISSLGVAARLMALRYMGAPETELAPARDAAIRAARTWHVFGSIGGPGVVARGVRRATPLDPSDPALPGTLPMTTPLADAQGNPLPADKQPTWRLPVASADDGWIWIDDTSKDQVSGYALAVAWLWDALSGDPAVPSDVLDALSADIGAFAKELMKVTPELGIDLCIRDADGRLTSFHDLNPQELSPGGVVPADSLILNGFNAALALGVVRAAYHVTGDPDIGKFYYEELVGARDLPGIAAKDAGFLYVGATTNYSNVNMLAIALATLGRFETDPKVRTAFGDLLEHQFWSVDGDRDASHVAQPWYDDIYAAFAAAPDVASIRTRVTENLGGFQPAPAIERDMINCDDTEIAAGSCIGVDGTTAITLLPKPGWGGGQVAKEPLPMAIRPDSDFEWRSDPHSVNGSASTRMDPRGDWLTAYYFARVIDTASGATNLSPHARPPLAYDGAGGGSSGSGQPSDAAADDSGCACALWSRSGADGRGAFALLMLAALARRRRGARVSG